MDDPFMGQLSPGGCPIPLPIGYQRGLQENLQDHVESRTGKEYTTGHLVMVS